MTNLVAITMDYKSVVCALMLGEANYFSEKLSLNTHHPIPVNEVIQCNVPPPKYGFGAMLSLTNYVFFFSKDGKLHTIDKSNDGFHELLRPEQLNALVGKPSLITKGQAYTMATQWLSSVSVDVEALNRAVKPVTKPWQIYDDSNTHLIDLPVFEVKWEGAAQVIILGTTKELVQLQLLNVAFSKRPPLVVTNVDFLLSQPDPPPKKLIPPSQPGVSKSPK